VEEHPHATCQIGTNKKQSSYGNVATSVPPWVVAAFLIIAVTGCEKNRGEAVVLAKEHIDAALPTEQTPNAQPASSSDEQIRPMADGEIAVDGT
jgi:hypothetical protein